MNIKFKVTPTQKETIDLRVSENGFDELSAYLKVVALKTQKFTIRNKEELSEETSIELSFDVSEAQNKVIERNIEECECSDLSEYMQHVAQHGVVTSVIEIRSTGKLDAMLERIAKARGLNLNQE